MGEVSEVIGGGTPNTSNSRYFSEDGIPWITPADLSGYREKLISRGARSITQQGLDGSGAQLMPAGTVLFSSRAPIGYVAVAANPLTTNQGFKSFVLEKGFDPSYVYFYLKRARELALSLSSGTTFQEISGAKARLIPIPVAPLSEQWRIAAKIEELFSDLDVGVATLERVKANLARYRATVLKAAVEGKLTAEWRKKHPDVQPASKLLERTLAERRKRWEEADLSKYVSAGKPSPRNPLDRYKEPVSPDIGHLQQLPNGWTWASFDQCAWEITVGHVGPMKDEYSDNGLPFLRSQNVRPLRFNREGIKKIPQTFDRRLSKSRLFGGELLVVRSGVNFGDCCVYPIGEPQGNCADLVITRLLTSVNPEYASIFVSSPIGQAFIGGRRTGSAQPHFNIGSMKKSQFPLPPKAEQDAIVEEVSLHLSVLDECWQQLSNLGTKIANLRKSILQQAFEGKLVPQDPKDESARCLLDRVKAEREAAQPKRSHVPVRKWTSKETV